MRDELLDALGSRLRALRRERELSLDALAGTSGVSRSMISEIERGAKAPTVLVLARIATALGSTVSRLLGEDQAERVVHTARAEQPAVVAATGWERRVLSPNLAGVEFEFIRTFVPPGVEIGEFAAHAPGSREYLAVESGELTVTVDGVPYLLRAGDSLFYTGDRTHAFANTGPAECVYYTVMHVAGPHISQEST